jgi:hypothetical protein
VAEKNLWLSNLLDVVMSHLGAPLPESGSPGPFALGDPARLRDLLDGAGFADVKVEEIETEQVYESLDGWWERLLSVGGPLKAILAPLSDAEVNAIRDATLSSAQEFIADDGSAVFPATVIGARAQKP